MGQPVSRVGDFARNDTDSHECPQCPHRVEGPAKTGSPNVTVNGRPVVRLCDIGSHSSCCGENAWEAIEGAASVLINGRPIVRMGDLSQHCGGSGALVEGSDDCVVGGPTVLASVTPSADLAAFIMDEMKGNAGGDHDRLRGHHVRWLQDNNEVWQLDNIIPGKLGWDKGQAYRRFGILAWPANKLDWGKAHIPNISEEEKKILGIWDHKPFIKKNYGMWSYDDVSGNSYQYDVWSNVHFGYVGAASGFSDWELKSGAGVGQLLAGTSDVGIFDKEYWRRRFSTLGDADVLAAFDDPKDQAAIQLGIDLWRKYGTELTADELMDAIRATSGLASRSGMMRC